MSIDAWPSCSMSRGTTTDSKVANSWPDVDVSRWRVVMGRARPRVVELAVESPQHARLGDLGQQVFDGDGRDEGFGDLAC